MRWNEDGWVCMSHSPWYMLLTALACSSHTLDKSMHSLDLLLLNAFGEDQHQTPLNCFKFCHQGVLTVVGSQGKPEPRGVFLTSCPSICQRRQRLLYASSCMVLVCSDLPLSFAERCKGAARPPN